MLDFPAAFDKPMAERLRKSIVYYTTYRENPLC